ncbi:type VI secretion protein IcmF [Pluralibacter gergoviae]|nr:type VI secretion protein IcmF [Pluralibacter gergoviae]
MLNKIISFLWRLLPKLKPSWRVAGMILWAAILVAAWWVGEKVHLGDNRPLETLWSKTVFTLVWLWGLCGICIWVVLHRMRQIRKQKQALEATEKDPFQAVVDGQQNFLDGWLAALRNHLGHTQYKMPWYLMLGMTGSGKSSLVHRANSANKFNVRIASELNALAPGQQIDCWLGEEAVVIDPKGELLQQSEMSATGDSEKQQRLWRHLLKWITENRKRQPLNGLVITLDMAWLSCASISDRKVFSQILRARLLDIITTMNTRLPVYLVLTRLDMLNGFSAFYQQLSKEERHALLGVTFSANPDSVQAWMDELNQFWDQWITALNDNLAEKMLPFSGESRAGDIFSFVRQLTGLKDYLREILDEVMARDNQAQLVVRGLYLSSVYQQSVPFDAFAHAASQRYALPDAIHRAQRGKSNVFFVRDLFSSVIFPEAHLAGESRMYQMLRRRRMSIGTGAMVLVALAIMAGWHHYYRENEKAGRNVLARAQQFISTQNGSEQQPFGVSLLPRLNLIREATFSFGNYRDKSSPLADMGLYQGDDIGPYVEASYLQLLQLHFLPAVMAVLEDDLQNAPPSSDARLCILRVIRMIEDASGRNKPLVEQFMAQRWQKAFPEQGELQELLMQHLDYALEHTDWHKARENKDAAAIAAWEPFRKPVAAAQRELSKLPLFQRVYQSVLMRADDALPAGLVLRDNVGQSFDKVFTLRNASAGTVPRLFTWLGFNDFFVHQDKSLFDLTALDAWVLGLKSQVYLSDADRVEIQRQVNDRYVTDYINHWQKMLANVDVQKFDSPEQALAILTVITGNEQPFQRVLAALNDNTRNRKFNDGNAEMAKTINSRISTPFVPLNGTLINQGDNMAQIQEINQKLTELYQWLEQTVNAVDPGAAALKALQQRQLNQYSDPTFTLKQYSRSLPAPLNRWVSQIAEQVSALTVQLAMSSLNQEWKDAVVSPFNNQLADRYPFDPDSSIDAPLSDVESFFAPGGKLDGFYTSHLKPLVDAGLMQKESGSDVSAELMRQLDRAQRIRSALFNAQGKLEVHFVVEPLELTANKRRSVLNLDGQLLEYTHGRRQKTPLVWPNSLRDGAESKLTLVPDNTERSPRSIDFSGPWGMFRLIGEGSRTRSTRGAFDTRFPVDNGTMTYRIYSDESRDPFASDLFSQFHLPESLY